MKDYNYDVICMTQINIETNPCAGAGVAGPARMATGLQ